MFSSLFETYLSLYVFFIFVINKLRIKYNFIQCLPLIHDIIRYEVNTYLKKN